MDTIKVIRDYRLKQYAVIDLLISYFRLVKRSEESNLLTLFSRPLAAIRYDPALYLITSLFLLRGTHD